MKPLQVDEGTRVSISSQNLQVEADYQKYGIGEEDVLFHIVIQPTHGVVDLTNWDRTEVKLFSLSDVNNDRVSKILITLKLKKRFLFLTQHLNSISSILSIILLGIIYQ